MKSLYLLLILSLLISACGISTSKTPGPTVSETLAPSQTPTLYLSPASSSIPTYTPTPFLSATPTRTPTPTKTSYPIPPGISSREEMQLRMEDWVSGQIELMDEDLWLDENGEVIRLGLYNRIIDHVDFMFYNLGFLILEDKRRNPYLLNVAGFEDHTGQRFTFLFHNGELYASHETIVLKEFTDGRIINSGIQIKFENLTPLEFVKGHYGGVVGLVNMGSTHIGPAGRPEYRADFFLRTSEETIQALTDFLACMDCSLEDAPEDLSVYINTIPLEFDVKTPYLWWYVVKYW